MIPDLDEMVGQLMAAASVPTWDSNVANPYAAVAAHHHSKKDETMEKSTADIILAGVHSCMLATLAIDVTKDHRSVAAECIREAAVRVLKHWGLDVKAPEAQNQAPDASPPPEQQTLVWPPVDRLGRPLATNLHDVYKENYYHVHEQTMLSRGIDGLILNPEDELTLQAAYWNEESLTWRMQFASSHKRFWLSHSQVKPGEEIPKSGSGT